MEYLGKIPKHEAELAAYRDWRVVVGNGVMAPDHIQRVVTAARKAMAEV